MSDLAASSALNLDALHESDGHHSVYEEKRKQAYRAALELYRKEPDWVRFFRETLGVGGIVDRLFKEPETTQFQRSREYDEIQKMLSDLRERNPSPSDTNEPTKVITVRLPKSLHESLQAEAHDRKTSMNKLCIAKLLRAIEDGETN